MPLDRNLTIKPLAFIADKTRIICVVVTIIINLYKEETKETRNVISWPFPCFLFLFPYVFALAATNMIVILRASI